MKAAVFKDVREIKIEKLENPKIKNEEALVRVKYAGICGTDLHIFEGLYPRALPPLVLGHEISGAVEDIKTKRKDIKIGDKVVINPLLSCGKCFPCKEGHPHICPNLNLIGIDKNGGFAEYVSVHPDKLYKIPNSLSLDLAALMEPVAVAVHAVRKSELSLGSKVVIIGGGPIGQLISQICQINGATSTLLLEINQERLNFAKKSGIIISNSIEEAIKKINKITDGKGADIVYEAVGIQDTFSNMTELVKAGGKIIVVGAPSKPITLNLWKVYFEELNIIGIHAYESKDIEIAIELLSKYSQIFQPFISKTIRLEDLQSKLTELANGTSNSMKVLVKMDN